MTEEAERYKKLAEECADEPLPCLSAASLAAAKAREATTAALSQDLASISQRIAAHEQHLAHRQAFLADGAQAAPGSRRPLPLG